MHLNAKQHLEKAYRVVAAMMVNGDNQDLAAIAKSEIKAALEELTEVKTDG